jgi:hypothetical protein
MFSRNPMCVTCDAGGGHVVRAGHHLLQLEPSAAVRPSGPAGEQLANPRNMDQPGLASGPSPPARRRVQHGPGRGTAGLLERCQPQERYLLLLCQNVMPCTTASIFRVEE